MRFRVVFGVVCLGICGFISKSGAWGLSADTCCQPSMHLSRHGEELHYREEFNCDRKATTQESSRDSDRQVVQIVAERFSFSPSEIRVEQGVTLELRVRSEDTQHGFRIVGRNVNVMVPKRRHGEVVVVFRANDLGVFEFHCTRLCGAGHNFMRGSIIVEPTVEKDEVRN